VSLSKTAVPVQTIAQLTEIINAVVPGEWLTFESLGTGVEETAAKLAAGRTKDNAQVTELRGVLKLAAGKELKSGETLGTLPASLRPLATRYVDASSGLAATTSTGNKLKIAATGVVTVAVAVKEGEEVFLDGETFAIL
jgi:hypothetical protein